MMNAAQQYPSLGDHKLNLWQKNIICTKVSAEIEMYVLISWLHLIQLHNIFLIFA